MKLATERSTCIAEPSVIALHPRTIEAVATCSNEQDQHEEQNNINEIRGAEAAGNPPVTANQEELLLDYIKLCKTAASVLKDKCVPYL